MFMICDSRHEDLQLFWLEFQTLTWTKPMLSMFMVLCCTSTMNICFLTPHQWPLRVRFGCFLSSPTCYIFISLKSEIQSSAIIAWSNLSGYHIWHCNNSGRMWVRFWNHNSHISPMRAWYGSSIVRILEKTDRVIMALRCIFHICHCNALCHTVLPSSL